MSDKIIVAFLLLLGMPLLANGGSLQIQTLFGLLLGAFGAVFFFQKQVHGWTM